jgi:hypothetical protein
VLATENLIHRLALDQFSTVYIPLDPAREKLAQNATRFARLSFQPVNAQNISIFCGKIKIAPRRSALSQPSLRL